MFQFLYIINQKTFTAPLDRLEIQWEALTTIYRQMPVVLSMLTKKSKQSMTSRSKKLELW